MEQQLAEAIVRRIDRLEETLAKLLTDEFMTLLVGDGVPSESAAEGVGYWDYTNDQLYVNLDGATGWQNIGGGGGASPHQLLSHTDATPAAVQRGDLVVGQGATPAWARLAVGASGTFLKSDGTDLAWQTIGLDDLDDTSLADPNADRIMFWDDSDGAYEWLTPGAGLSITVNTMDVDHDAANNFVANEHIDHTGVTLIAGAGLTGGGDIAASRTFAVGAGDGIDVAADSIAVDVTDILGNGMAETSNNIYCYELRQSDDGGAALTADAAGNLTMSGNLTIESGSPYIYINSTQADPYAPIIWQDGGVNRWYLAYGPGTTDNLWLYSYGASLVVLRMEYANGYIGLGTASTPTSRLVLGFATEDLDLVDGGSVGATEQDWIEVKVGGNTGYIRVYASK